MYTKHFKCAAEKIETRGIDEGDSVSRRYLNSSRLIFAGSGGHARSEKQARRIALFEICR